ncbi:MAG: hypothetical protein WCR72_01560 [Bacteroidota bacterium]
MKNRKLVYSFALMGIIMMFANGCKKSENAATGNPIQNNKAVESALVTAGITTYNGGTPPHLDGVYSTATMQIYNASSILSAYIGQNMSSIFKLYNQSSTGDISFAEQFSDGTYADGKGCYITGSGQNFTIWMESTLSNGGATAFILTGTLEQTTGNIINCHTLTVYTKATPNYSVGDWYAASGWLQNVNNIVPLTGQAMFWTSRADVSYISVYVSNVNVGTISVYSTSGQPVCGTSGFVTVDKSPGTYSFTASDGKLNWSGTIIVSAGGCYKMQLL